MNRADPHTCTSAHPLSPTHIATHGNILWGFMWLPPKHYCTNSTWRMVPLGEIYRKTLSKRHRWSKSFLLARRCQTQHTHTPTWASSFTHTFHVIHVANSVTATYVQLTNSSRRSCRWRNYHTMRALLDWMVSWLQDIKVNSCGMFKLSKERSTNDVAFLRIFLPFPL